MMCSKRDANLDKLARSLALVLLWHFGHTPAWFKRFSFNGIFAR